MNILSPLPDAFLKRMQRLLSKNSMDDFVEAMNSTAPVSVRLHPFKDSQYKRNSGALVSVPWCGLGYYLDQRPIFTIDPGFHSGGYYVQEASSMLIEVAMKYALTKYEDPMVLDLCAAPGGKSTLILSLLNQHGLLVSNDPIHSRIPSLTHNFTKWGYANQIITNSDPERFSELPHFFDIVLVDAPCSGEGLFRKDHDSRNEWSESNAHQCAQRQSRILKHAFETLNPGGYLIYSTCTFNAAENIDQVCYLNSLGLESVKMPELSSFGLEQIEKDQSVGYQAYPHKIMGEGFFISLLQKTGGIEGKNISSSSIEWVQSPAVLQQYIDIFELTCFMHKETYHAFPFKYQQALEELKSKVKIISSGIECGNFKHRDFIPHHALSQYHLLKEELPSVDLDDKIVLDYLKGNTVPNAQGLNGYLLAIHQTEKLGWAKAVQGRMNNLYPHPYRIKGNF